MLRYYAWQTEFQWARYDVFAFGMFTDSCVMGELIIMHLRNAIKDHESGDIVKVAGIPFPTRYFADWQGCIAAMLALFLGLMVSHCPVLYCFQFHAEFYEGHGLWSETCSESPAKEQNQGG